MTDIALNAVAEVRFMLDQKIRERVVLGDELRVAIEHRALELHYQPRVEIVSGRIVGLEALVRWNHPKRGFIPPSIFIPIAEKTGAIAQLGKWVFDEACRQARVWQDEGIAPAAIGVNVSTIQCKRSDIVKEVTESVLMERRPPRRSSGRQPVHDKVEMLKT